MPQLWQDCPFLPFDKLESDEAQARLSVCKPISGLEEVSCINNVPRYAHNTGDVCFRRRQPLQLASTLGFILNQKGSKFLNLSPEESSAVHECLTWARQPGNNRVLTFFGTTYEGFQAACKKLMAKFKSVIPEGCLRARIRAHKRESRTAKDSTLGTTLGA